MLGEGEYLVSIDLARGTAQKRVTGGREGEKLRLHLLRNMDGGRSTAGLFPELEEKCRKSTP